jgi:hypothetical protein
MEEEDQFEAMMGRKPDPNAAFEREGLSSFTAKASKPAAPRPPRP